MRRIAANRASLDAADDLDFNLPYWQHEFGRPLGVEVLVFEWALRSIKTVVRAPKRVVRRVSAAGCICHRYPRRDG